MKSDNVGTKSVWEHIQNTKSRSTGPTDCGLRVNEKLSIHYILNIKRDKSFSADSGQNFYITTGFIVEMFSHPESGF